MVVRNKVYFYYSLVIKKWNGRFENRKSVEQVGIDRLREINFIIGNIGDV